MLKWKNYLIINIVSGGRGEFVWCFKLFVWDCRCIYNFINIRILLYDIYELRNNIVELGWLYIVLVVV